MAYHDPIYATYTAAAASLTSAATLLKVAGPKGKKGAIVGLSAVVTTAVTVADATVTVGTTDDADKYATLDVEVASVNDVFSDAVISPVDSNLIAPDSVVALATGGEATAGAATITVTIAWF
ncbi:MAG: hypothetical protein WC997_15810 [Porticoccaceae bacterium]